MDCTPLMRSRARRGDEMDTRESRFRFGANWRSFARLIDEDRVREASASLSSHLGDISGMSFLDAGCGSGLFSLAAARLGAGCVHSFDLDVDSVETTLALQRRFAPAAARWTIEQGDILDRPYLDKLGKWDIVYAWGVLHHTGDMVAAWECVARLVSPRGRLFISIYNDEGPNSIRWRSIKRVYQGLPYPLRPLLVLLALAPRELRTVAASGPASYARAWRTYKTNRGMSRWHDMVDWVGGYPFEVAKPDVVLEFFQARGFIPEVSHTTGAGSGCNEFLFRLPVAT